jgi:hypothetical protein
MSLDEPEIPIKDTLREAARLEGLLALCVGNYERLHLKNVDTSHEEAAGENQTPMHFDSELIMRVFQERTNFHLIFAT